MGEDVLVLIGLSFFTFDLFNQLGNGSGGFSHSRLSSFFFQFVESARSEQDDVTQLGPAPRWQR